LQLAGHLPPARMAPQWPLVILCAATELVDGVAKPKMAAITPVHSQPSWTDFIVDR